MTPGKKQGIPQRRVQLDAKSRVVAIGVRHRESMSAIRNALQPEPNSRGMVFDEHQMVALFGTNGRFSKDELREMQGQSMSSEFLLANGVRAMQLLVARVTPEMLCKGGMDVSASGLRTFGFDALHMTDPAFCASCIRAFGAENVAENFLVNAHDAVALAGTASASQLGLSANRLLKACAGFPAQATAVIQQLRESGVTLKGVSAVTILDTALRSHALSKLGYTAASLSEETKATPKQLKQLGW